MISSYIPARPAVHDCIYDCAPRLADFGELGFAICGPNHGVLTI